MDTPSTNTVWKSVKPFFNGGLSGMLATCVIQPIDMVKVRIQLGAQGSPVRPRHLNRLWDGSEHILLYKVTPSCIYLLETGTNPCGIDLNKLM